MDKKTKIFFFVFVLLIIGSVAATYWRIMVKRDYVVEAQTDCDPYLEECFIWECDPESDVEGEACIGDPELDTWYFKVARRNAANIPLCDPNTDEDCDPWTCEEGEKDCESILCTEDQLEAQYASGCVDPVAYAEENPIEEEEEEDVVCEEGDEECIQVEEDAVVDEDADAEDTEEDITAEEEVDIEEDVFEEEDDDFFDISIE